MRKCVCINLLSPQTLLMQANNILLLRIYVPCANLGWLHSPTMLCIFLVIKTNYPHKQCDKNANPHKVSRMRTKETSISQMAIIEQSQGRRRKELQTKYGLYGKYNPLFQLSVDHFRYTHIGDLMYTLYTLAHCTNKFKQCSVA